MELTVDDLFAHPVEADGPLRQAMSRRPVDLVQLARYTLGNRSHEREVLELFRAQCGHYLKRLAATVSDKEWHDAAHTIKGSAACIGAWRVAKTAEAAETVEGEALAARRDEIVAELAHEIDETNGYIVRLLVDA